MVVTTESVFDWAEDAQAIAYDNAIVYGDADQSDVLHEGPIRLLSNGWIVLPSDRLLSPRAVHHVDRYPS